jgi:type VI secretion system secreted protein Hcp
VPAASSTSPANSVKRRTRHGATAGSPSPKAIVTADIVASRRHPSDQAGRAPVRSVIAREVSTRRYCRPMEQVTRASGDEYFIKIDGIPGESRDAQHVGEIDVESWSWGEANPSVGSSSTGSGAGRVQMRDLVFTARVSRASPKLLLACAAGQRVLSAVLSARRPGGAQRDFLIIALTDVRVSSYETDSREVGSGVFDRVLLHFAKIQVEYRPQAPDGSAATPVKVGWDVLQNQAI